MPDQDKPAKIAINLDKLDRETPDQPPFSFVLDGKPYTLGSPDEIAWEIVRTAMMFPERFLKAAMAEDEQKTFTAAVGSLKSWKVQRLVEAWTEHYGLPSLPE